MTDPLGPDEIDRYRRHIVLAEIGGATGSGWGTRPGVLWRGCRFALAPMPRPSITPENLATASPKT